MRVPIFDSRGKVIGSEPAPQRYCSEEEQKRIRQEKARYNYFYQEGYDDGLKRVVEVGGIIHAMCGWDAYDAYKSGYAAGFIDSSPYYYLDDPNDDVWGE